MSHIIRFSALACFTHSGLRFLKILEEEILMRKRLALVSAITLLCISFTPVTVLPTSALTPNLIAKYDFENINSSVIPDVSGNGHNGTAYHHNRIEPDGYPWGYCEPEAPKLLDLADGGHAADFSGEDYIDLPGNIVQQLGDNFTISFWVKPKDTLGTWTRFIDMSNECNNNGSQWNYKFFIGQVPVSDTVNPGLTFSLNPPSGGVSVITSDSSSYGFAPVGKWTQITYVMNNENLYLYINGVQVSVQWYGQQDVTGHVWCPYMPADIASNIQRIRLGTGQFSWDHSFNGYMDNVSFYSAALTSVEVDSLFDTEKPYTYSMPNVVARYDFDTIYSSTIADVSGNGYDGTAKYHQRIEPYGYPWGTVSPISPNRGPGVGGSKAMSFLGNCFVDLPSGIANKLNHNFTISFWVNPIYELHDWCRVIDMSNNCNNDSGQWTNKFFIGQTQTPGGFGGMSFSLVNGTDGVSVITSNPGTAGYTTPNQWTQYTYVMNNQTLSLYKNGVQVSVQWYGQQDVTGTVWCPLMPADFAQNIPFIRLGASQFSWEWSIPAYLDNVTFYEGAMTGSQVADVYDRELTGDAVIDQPRRYMTLNTLNMRDPCIYADQATHTYYLLGTTGNGYASDNVGYMFYKSHDLSRWYGPYDAFNSDDNGITGDYVQAWAPEMFKLNGYYYIFGTVVLNNNTCKSIITRSSSPDGPYTYIGDATPSGVNALDATLYVNPSGQPYSIYAKGGQYTGELDYIKLKSDMTGVDGSPTGIIYGTTSTFPNFWLGSNRTIIEAPYVHVAYGQLYILWSTMVDINGSVRYAIIQSKSANGSLNGPWVTSQTTMTSADEGHCAVFMDFNGLCRLVCHAPNQPFGAERPVIHYLDDSVPGTLTVIP